MSYQSKHTGAAIDASVDTTQKILNMIYPVGSIYMSVNNVSPATFIGGTWTALTDRVLIGAGSSYAVNATGGATSHTHTSAAHSHTTAGHTLTANEMPSHSHGETMPVQGYSEWSSYTTTSYCVAIDFSSGNNYFGPGKTLNKATTGACGATTSATGGGASHSHGNTGSTTPGNTGSSSNLPPYLAVYMWKRTA